MMAISVEHLGAQVQCPHCAAVVQTPPRSALGPLPGPDPQGAAVEPPQPQYDAPSIHVPERESIFAEPEPSDDLFDHDNSPKIQMPEPEMQLQHGGHTPTVAMEEEPTGYEPDEENANFVARQRLAQA